jgi:hypothetical protein
MRTNLKLPNHIRSGLAAIALLAAAFPQLTDASEWTFDVTLYGLAAGMSGDLTVRGVNADLDVGFDTIWDNLDFGAMGKVRAGYGRWGFAADVIYMGLEASKNGVRAEMDQWVVEPSVGYTVRPGFEVLAGARYNNLNGEISGPFGRHPSGTQDWWDPIVGANLAFPVSSKVTLAFRADIGGFDVGSDLTWQAFPSVNWRFSKLASLQAGYRWVYTDYETGSGATLFRYDILTQGPQLGVKLSF